MLKTALPLALKNALRNRRRTALTVSSIAVSLCLLGVLGAIYHALFYGNETTPAQALRLFVHHKVSLANALPVAYGEKIRHVQGVRSEMFWQWFGGTYKDARDTRNFFGRFAVEPSKVFGIFSELRVDPDQRRAFERQRTACIAARPLAERLGWKIGDRIPIKGDIYPVDLELTLAGVFDDPNGNENLFFNREYLDESLGANSRRRDIVMSFVIQVNTPEDAPRVAQAIDAMFDNAPEPTLTESEKAFALSFVSFLGNLKVFLMAICGAVTFTILLVSANTLSMSVRERVREIGILKTLGFGPREILGTILGEAAIIALAGGAAGCALASLLCTAVHHAQLPFPALKLLAISPPLAALCLGIALAIGLASALAPAVNASRTSILNALRHTG